MDRKRSDDVYTFATLRKTVAHFCLILVSICVMADLPAQNILSGQPSPFGAAVPIARTKDISSCREKDCDLTSAQVSALYEASSFYARDMPTAKEYSALVGLRNREVWVTFMPLKSIITGDGAARKRMYPITYRFSEDGKLLLGKFYNR